MPRKTPSTKRRAGAKRAPTSRRRVRAAIDSGLETLRDGLLAADGEVRKRVTALADRLSGQHPAEVLQALAGELQARLEKVREAIPTTPAAQRRVREQVVAGIADLRKRASTAVAGRRARRSAR